MYKINRKLTILLVLFSFVLLISVQNSIAQAYTVMSGKWSTTSTAYVIDSSFSSQGTGWSSRFNSAASNWSQLGAFGFSSNSSSSNHIQASNIASSCNGCLAQASVWGNPINQFKIVVNIGSGYAFYDGTQASTLPSNYYDLRSVMHHELGHAQGLCHSGTSSYLMYRSIGTGVLRVVDTDAKNGSKYLYQSDYQGPAPEGPSCQVK